MDVLGVGGRKEGKLANGYKNDFDKFNLADAMEIEPVPENVERLKQCYVGTLWDARLTSNVQMMILMEGYQQLKATMLGVDKILLSSSREDGVKKAYEEDKKWWESKFSHLKPWSPIQKPIGRLI
jgi:hypothetical protein